MLHVHITNANGQVSAHSSMYFYGSFDACVILSIL